MAELILALDTPRGDDAIALLNRLPALRWVKVGSIIMTQEGPGFVRRLIERGLDVFLDLKWHDIPNTVAGAVTSARNLGVSMATVHVLGGKAMLEAAVEASAGELALVGVTVLTSHDAASYEQALGRTSVNLATEVGRLGQIAIAAGLQGMVCSPSEVSVLRERLGPKPFLVVPGIRRGSDAKGDQVRVSSPEDAIRHGATHLVVGRPVLQAANPRAVLEELMKEAGCVIS
ncbi:MAG TPA: orotidine-5'-phosphate decarboxylase [Gemmatimonadales bacterium]|nr:orotidine-5'-phosphate decarboxylase [Gemmatimonadales bacterium]